jgi:hypothetical protein
LFILSVVPFVEYEKVDHFIIFFPASRHPANPKDRAWLIQAITEPAYQRLRRALGARKTFFDDLRALTRHMLFDSWDDLFTFMQEGLEIALEPP